MPASRSTVTDSYLGNPGDIFPTPSRGPRPCLDASQHDAQVVQPPRFDGTRCRREFGRSAASPAYPRWRVVHHGRRSRDLRGHLRAGLAHLRRGMAGAIPSSHEYGNDGLADRQCCRDLERRDRRCPAPRDHQLDHRDLGGPRGRDRPPVPDPAARCRSPSMIGCGARGEREHARWRRVAGPRARPSNAVSRPRSVPSPRPADDPPPGVQFISRGDPALVAALRVGVPCQARDCSPTGQIHCGKLATDAARSVGDRHAGPTFRTCMVILAAHLTALELGALHAGDPVVLHARQARGADIAGAAVLADAGTGPGRRAMRRRRGRGRPGRRCGRRGRPGRRCGRRGCRRGNRGRWTGGLHRCVILRRHRRRAGTRMFRRGCLTCTAA